MKNLKTFARFFAFYALILTLGACAMFTGRETPGQYIDDTTITTKVKANILAENSLKVLQINVETMQGVVQLSGFVDSQKSKNKAEEIAGRVSTVKSVKNNLVVR